MNKTFKNISIEKQNMIIEAAFKEFSIYGFENSSTNRLVKTIGISKGSLYKYFSTKLELYIFLVNIAVERLLKHYDTYEVKGENWKKRLLNYASIEFDFLIKEPITYQFFYKLVNEINHPQLKSIKKELEELSNKYLSKIFHSINLPTENFEFLTSHISYILSGYNQTFFESLSSIKVVSNEKDRYLSGLKTHLNFVR